MSRKYESVDVWIANEGPHAGLPVKVRAARKKPTGQLDSYLTVTFEQAELNRGFSSSVFDLEPPAGYEVYVERLEPINVPDKGREPDQP